MNLKNYGFTLLELLVVIAILGILAAVIVGSINDSRQKSIDAAARAQAREILNLVAFCETEGFTLIPPPNGSGVGGTPVCTGGSMGTVMYPPLPPGWRYEELFLTLDPEDPIFRLLRIELVFFSAIEYRITCTRTSCQISKVSSPI